MTSSLITHHSSLAPAKPRKIIVPLAVGLDWRADPDYIYQEKLDGRFETRQVRGTLEDLGDTLLAGEYVRGEFYAFDILRLRGEDIRHAPLQSRRMVLDAVFDAEPVDCTGGEIHQITESIDGGCLLRAVLARGGEGVVRKHLASPWGAPMEACKRLETFRCVVTGINAGQSVRLARVISPECSVFSPKLKTENLNLQTVDCGSVSLFGGKTDRVRVGSILKIEGFGLTREGKIREPRPCKDTASSWLIRY